MRFIRIFQGRLGSGIDVQTSLQGGMLVYNRHQVGKFKNIKLRSDLRFKIFWSGEEIKTIDQLKLFSDYNAKSFRQLCDISNKLSNNWCKYDPKKLISEIKTYVKCLEEFSMDFGLDLFGANHNYLCEYTKNMTEAVYINPVAQVEISVFALHHLNQILILLYVMQNLLGWNP